MKYIKKIAKAILGVWALLAAGCHNGHQCGCGCHHDHDDHTTIAWKAGTLYKIVIPANFNAEKTDDCVMLSPLDKQSGFIHAGYGQQVDRIIKKFFAAESELLVLELDSDLLKKNGTEIRQEANKPGGDIFPHLYGIQKIQRSAVKVITALKKDEHGDWEEKT